MSGKRKIAILLALLIIGVVLYLSRSLFFAATVNGEFIYRPTVVKDLEKRFGQQTLDSLITEMLINQEAKKRNITVTSEEVDAEITKIEENVKGQGQELATLLSLQGMTMEELRTQIKTQKIAEKMLSDKINPTDQEIDEYIKANPSTDKDAKPEDIRAQVKTQLTQQKLGTEFQAWLTEAKKNASIQYFVKY